MPKSPERCPDTLDLEDWINLQRANEIHEASVNELRDPSTKDLEK